MTRFQEWFDQAVASGSPEPNAMTLATTTRDGRPSARMVLLKGVDEQGFVFYTNYDSRKGRELKENARAALVFFWPQLGRQIRVTGEVAKVTAAESDAYFFSRPLGSRFSAAVSDQSSVIESREVLEKKLADLKAQYREQGPPRPKHWGGFRVQPDEIEFWEQGEFRLHDRFLYRRSRGGDWTRERLSP
jgi:pyridoxamine 5'-phosphate oxidase